MMSEGRTPDDTLFKTNTLTKHHQQFHVKCRQVSLEMRITCKPEVSLDGRMCTGSVASGWHSHRKYTRWNTPARIQPDFCDDHPLPVISRSASGALSCASPDDPSARTSSHTACTDMVSPQNGIVCVWPIHPISKIANRIPAKCMRMVFLRCVDEGAT